MLVIRGVEGIIGGGAAGAAAGVTDTALEATLSHTPFIAVSVIEYSVPFVRSAIVKGLEVPALI